MNVVDLQGLRLLRQDVCRSGESGEIQREGEGRRADQIDQRAQSTRSIRSRKSPDLRLCLELHGRLAADEQTHQQREDRLSGLQSAEGEDEARRADRRGRSREARSHSSTVSAHPSVIPSHRVSPSSETDIAKERVAKLLNAGANVILTTGGIDDLCLKQFVEAGAMAVRRCKKADLKRIAKATGGRSSAKVC